MYENNEDAAAPAHNRRSLRDSVQRPSHIWNSSKRNFIDDPEYEKLKASVARPEQVQRLRARN